MLLFFINEGSSLKGQKVLNCLRETSLSVLCFSLMARARAESIFLFRCYYNPFLGIPFGSFASLLDLTNGISWLIIVTSLTSPLVKQEI